MSDARWHRTERDPSQACRTTACTDASALAAIAAWSRGGIGPSTSLDQFRALQRDQEGGIDLLDAKYAARRLGVDIETWTAYHPGPEYTGAAAESLYEHGAITPAAATAELRKHRFGVLQLLCLSLPKDLRHDDTFVGPHAIGLLGSRNTQGWDELLIADPLALKAQWHAAAPYWTAAAALAGNGHANLALTPIREPLWRARVNPGAFWDYQHAGSGVWTRKRRLTGGFSATCNAPTPMTVLGSRRPMALLTSGFLRGHWLDADGWGVTVKEID